MTDMVVAGPHGIRARHPNASKALTHGSGLGALFVWIAGMIGLDMPPEIAAVVGGGIASLFLFVGRRGIKGVLRGIWNGSET